jgi:multimeric flavodoxin WrbA
MKRLLAINGSYREHGMIDQAVGTVLRAAEEAGMQVEEVRLRDFPIEFCRNCRECTQIPGAEPGRCVQHDQMHALIERIEAADGYILASPTNFSSVTALFKRLMERLMVYAYWPWGSAAPKMRRKGGSKPAVLIASCAAPGLMGRLSYNNFKQLGMTAKTIGARTVGRRFIGFASMQQQPELKRKEVERLRVLAGRLL